MFGKASIVQIRDWFGMSAAELNKEWKLLNEDEKEFFKVEVGKVLEIPA